MIEKEEDKAKRYNARSAALRDIVSVLIGHWGYEAVRRCIADAERTKVPETSLAQDSQSRVKLRPTEIVNRLEDSKGRREALSRLASAFEEKTFLPTIGHVRDFIAMRGKDVALPKSRNEAFRPLLKVLIEIDDHELVRIAESEAHSGPTHLEPLSDAINSAGRALRGSDDS